MKLMRYLAFSFTLLLSLLSHSAKTEDNQLLHNFAQEFNRKTIDPFLPVKFTADGINYFFSHVFNNLEYGTEFLPNDFSHLLQFLQHGVDTHQDAAYAQSVFKLFSNKLKSASYINAYVFTDLIAPLHELLKQYITAPKPKTKQELKVTVNDVLYSSFLSQFDFFKKNPKKFFGSLSDEIFDSLKHELNGMQKTLQNEQLRQTVVRFFELCTSKLVWSPEDPSDIWKTIQTAGNQFAALLNDKIIEDVDHVDDLLWSLTHRLCFFIDLTGADLPTSFYQTIKQDLLRKNSVLCRLEEQEQLITSKSELLMQTIATGQARARAREFGVIT